MKIKKIFEKTLSLPALAGCHLKGKWCQYVFSARNEMTRMDHFIAFYRGNVLQVDFFCFDRLLKKEVHDRVFLHIVSSVASMLYEGEKCSVPPVLKELVLRSFHQLVTDPENAVKEAHSLISFVEKSPLVIVKTDGNDIIWQKSLVKGTLAEQKYALLLTAAYMAGNAVAQIEKGICSDQRSAGVKAMKLVYGKLKGKHPSFSIPELEK